MSKQFLDTQEFKEIMNDNIRSVIKYLNENSERFQLVVNSSIITFNPELPEHIKSEVVQGEGVNLILDIVNYAKQSFKITDNSVSFETGFGSDNVGSVVTIPFQAIFNIIDDGKLVLVNVTSVYKSLKEVKLDDLIFSSIKDYEEGRDKKE